MKVLIVDDSKTMRTFLKYLVQDLQFTSAQAADGCEALSMLQHERDFDVALVDWDMPRMNGIEFVQAVRADPVYDGLKLLMVTAQTSLADVAVALTAGASDFLMKPVTREALADKLRLLGVVE